MARSSGGESILFSQICLFSSDDSCLVIERLLIVSDHLVNYLKYVSELPKQRRPNSQAYASVKESFGTSASYNRTCARLQFSKFVMQILTPFLRKFQSQKPMAIFALEEQKTIENVARKRRRDKRHLLLELKSLTDQKFQKLKATDIEVSSLTERMEEIWKTLKTLA